MRYTLRSSNASNLQGPLEFKRDKPVLETIQELDEEEYKPRLRYNIMFFICCIQVLSLCSILYYLTNNPFKVYVDSFYTNYIYYYFCLLKVNYLFINFLRSLLAKIYMSVLIPLDQAHNYLCQNILCAF